MANPITNDSKGIWRWKNDSAREEFEGSLSAYWEVHSDPMSNDYSPNETEAMDLLRKWAEKMKNEYEDNLIPISWYVRSKGLFEKMPFQFLHNSVANDETFLDHFTWPVNKLTGDPLNWLLLPVVDKLWNKDREDKGGFIQEATGWKPSILQPVVYLPSIMSAFSN